MKRLFIALFLLISSQSIFALREKLITHSYGFNQKKPKKQDLRIETLKKNYAKTTGIEPKSVNLSNVALYILTKPDPTSPSDA